jgi:hypothetical protein
VLYEKLHVEIIAFLIQTVFSGPEFHYFDARDIDYIANRNFDEDWQKYLAEFILGLNEDDRKVILEFMQNL